MFDMFYLTSRASKM